MRRLRRTAIVVTAVMAAGVLAASTPATAMIDTVVATLLGAEEVAPAAPKWQRRLVDAAKPTPAGVRMQVVVTESPISGASRAEFLEALAAKQRELSEDREAGRAPGGGRMLLKPQWETEVHLGSCQFKRATITVGYWVDFPTLAGPIAADSSEQAWWAAQQELSFERRVTTLKVLRDGAKEIFQKVNLLRGSTCGEVVTRANDIARQHTIEVYSRAGVAFSDIR